jgi:hypothetical protein
VALDAAQIKYLKDYEEGPCSEIDVCHLSHIILIFIFRRFQLEGVTSGMS